MTEVVKCPSCNAQLHVVPNNNILKCEYCGTEIIIDNNVQNFSAQTNNFSSQMNNHVNKDNYEEEMKKWKKSFHIHLIIQAVLSVFFGIFMEMNMTIGVIMFIISTVYSLVLPFYLIKDKPQPQQSQNNNKFLDFIKVYPAFAGAFWVGIILIAILVNI